MMNIVNLTFKSPGFKSQQPLFKMVTSSLLQKITARHRLKYVLWFLMRKYM